MGSRGTSEIRDRNPQNLRQNRTLSPVRKNQYVNAFSGPSQLYFICRIFENVQVPILIDSGSAVIIIDEEVWNLIKRRGKELDKMSFAIRSATQHVLEVLGQTKITFKLTYKHYKRGGRDF